MTRRSLFKAILGGIGAVFLPKVKIKESKNKICFRDENLVCMKNKNQICWYDYEMTIWCPYTDKCIGDCCKCLWEGKSEPPINFRHKVLDNYDANIIIDNNYKSFKTFWEERKIGKDNLFN